MGAVPQRGEKPHAGKGEMLSDQGEEDACTDERTDRDKKQRVCELPVVLQRQQGISVGLDQHIQIRGQACKRTDPQGVTQRTDLATRLCRGSANRSLTKWIHKRSVAELCPK